MRADRLVAVLLLLQQRGTITAAEVADELEVSVRTARRDLEALAMSGVPVYSRSGRGGGWSLVGGARTDLTGLTAAEVRALFLVAGQAPSSSPATTSALRKLAQAVPAPFRPQAEATSEAVLVDQATWGGTTPDPVPHLDSLQRAVVEGEQVRLGYRRPNQDPNQRAVHPLGLVVKRGVWYLVTDTEHGRRTFRVSRVTSVEPLGVPVVRPDGFDLDQAWADIVADIAAWGRGLVVSARIDPEMVGVAIGVFGGAIDVGGSDDDGWRRAEIGARSVDEAAGRIAGFGHRIRVTGPPEVQRALADIGRELLACYGASDDPVGQRPPTRTVNSSAR